MKEGKGIYYLTTHSVHLWHHLAAATSWLTLSNKYNPSDGIVHTMVFAIPDVKISENYITIFQ